MVRSAPESVFRSVDFPAPFGPRRQTSSPPPSSASSSRAGTTGGRPGSRYPVVSPRTRRTVDSMRTPLPETKSGSRLLTGGGRTATWNLGRWSARIGKGEGFEADGLTAESRCHSGKGEPRVCRRGRRQNDVDAIDPAEETFVGGAMGVGCDGESGERQSAEERQHRCGASSSGSHRQALA